MSARSTWLWTHDKQELSVVQREAYPTLAVMYRELASPRPSAYTPPMHAADHREAVTPHKEWGA